MLSAAELARLVSPASRLLGYFNHQVLASYRSESDKYELETDSFEGTLSVTEGYYLVLESEGRTGEYLNIRFGYRTLHSGELAVVVWMPDLADAKHHQQRWSGFALVDPQWTSGTDERFEKWARRNLEGSWEIDNGPRFKIAEVIATINGLTRESTGHPLYKHSIDSSLSFPAAENTHAYQDAHARLYGFLIDGLDKRVIAQLASQTGTLGKFDSDKTLDALTKLLPALAAPTVFATAMSKVSDQRRQASHAVRPRAERMEAFSTFTADLTMCLQTLHDVTTALESLLQLSALAAHRRNNARAWLPKLVRTPHQNASLLRAVEMEGKTIERVEIGEREDHPALHSSEAMILHFTDGTMLGIDTASNVTNLTSRRDDLQQNEFHVHFHLSWVPRLERGKTSGV